MRLRPMTATRSAADRPTTTLVVRSALQVAFALLLILGALPALLGAAGS